FSMGGNEGMRFKPNIPRYMAPSIVPSMQWSRPVPLAEKQPPSIMFPPPCLTVGMVFLRFKPNMPRYMAPSIVPSMQWSRPVPLAEKQPQSIMFPPPCLTVGMVFLGSYSAFFPLQTQQVELMPMSLILVSSD